MTETAFRWRQARSQILGRLGIVLTVQVGCNAMSQWKAARSCASLSGPFLLEAARECLTMDLSLRSVFRRFRPSEPPFSLLETCLLSMNSRTCLIWFPITSAMQRTLRIHLLHEFVDEFEFAWCSQVLGKELVESREPRNPAPGWESE